MVPLKVPSKFRADTVQTNSFKIVSYQGAKDKGTVVTTIWPWFKQLN